MTPKDLEKHDAVVYRRSGPVLPWLFPGDDSHTLEVIPPNRMRFDDLDAVADAVTKGMGLAWLPSWLVQERIKKGSLVLLLKNQPSFLYDVHAIWLKTPHLPLKVRLAIDTLMAALSKYRQ